MDHSQPQTFKVTIHLYDLSQGMAKAFSPMFLGKQIDVVYGKEYYFGGGICAGLPKQTPYGYPVQVIDHGETELTQDLLEGFLNDISKKYSMETYDLFTNNCNNFSNECSEFLVGKPIPDYITGLPQEVLNTQIGQMLKPMIDQMTNKVQNDTSQQHFNAGIQGQGPNQPSVDQQQELMKNVANLLQANMGAQVPAPQGQGNTGVQTGQQSNVIPIEDLDMFICCTESSPKCIIDFYADWCGPCVNIKPLFNELSNAQDNSEIQFYKVNIDTAREVAQQLSVNSVPTFMTYKGGVQAERWTGANQQTLKDKLQKLKE